MERCVERDAGSVAAIAEAVAELLNGRGAEKMGAAEFIAHYERALQAPRNKPAPKRKLSAVRVKVHIIHNTAPLPSQETLERVAAFVNHSYSEECYAIGESYRAVFGGAGRMSVDVLRAMHADPSQMFLFACPDLGGHDDPGLCYPICTGSAKRMAFKVEDPDLWRNMDGFRAPAALPEPAHFEDYVFELMNGATHPGFSTMAEGIAACEEACMRLWPKPGGKHLSLGEIINHAPSPGVARLDAEPGLALYYEAFEGHMRVYEHLGFCVTDNVKLVSLPGIPVRVPARIIWRFSRGLR